MKYINLIKLEIIFIFVAVLMLSSYSASADELSNKKLKALREIEFKNFETNEKNLLEEKNKNKQATFMVERKFNENIELFDNPDAIKDKLMIFFSQDLKIDNLIGLNPQGVYQELTDLVKKFIDNNLKTFNITSEITSFILADRVVNITLSSSLNSSQARILFERIASMPDSNLIYNLLPDLKVYLNDSLFDKEEWAIKREQANNDVAQDETDVSSKLNFLGKAYVYKGGSISYGNASNVGNMNFNAALDLLLQYREKLRAEGKDLPQVNVAVIDTGILSEHPDFKGRLLPGYDFVGVSISQDGDGYDPDPEDVGDADGDYYSVNNSSSYHGSYVSSIIAANRNDRKYMFGATLDNVKIIPVRVLGAGGGSTADISNGIKWAAGGEVIYLDSNKELVITKNENPADVINMSLGSSAWSRFSKVGRGLFANNITDFMSFYFDGRNVANGLSGYYGIFSDYSATEDKNSTLIVKSSGNSNFDSARGNDSTKPFDDSDNPLNVMLVGAHGIFGTRSVYSTYGGTALNYSNFGVELSVDDMFAQKNNFACVNLRENIATIVDNCTSWGYSRGFNNSLQSDLSIIFSKFLGVDNNTDKADATKDATTKLNKLFSSTNATTITDNNKIFIKRVINDSVNAIDQATSEFRQAYKDGKGSLDSDNNERLNFALVGGDSSTNPYLKVVDNKLYPTFIDGFSVTETLALLKTYYDISKGKDSEIYFKANNFVCENLNNHFDDVEYNCSETNFTSGFYKSFSEDLGLIFSKFLAADNDAKVNEVSQETETKLLGYFTEPGSFISTLISDSVEKINQATAEFRQVYEDDEGSLDSDTNEKLNFALVGGDSLINPYLKVVDNKLYPTFIDDFSFAETFSLAMTYYSTKSADIKQKLENFYNNKDNDEEFKKNISQEERERLEANYKQNILSVSFGQGRIGFFYPKAQLLKSLEDFYQNQNDDQSIINSKDFESNYESFFYIISFGQGRIGKIYGKPPIHSGGVDITAIGGNLSATDKKFKDGTYGSICKKDTPEQTIYSSDFNKCKGAFGTKEAQGTSFSAPYVAAAAAVLKSFNKEGNQLTGAQIKQLLKENTRPYVDWLDNDNIISDLDNKPLYELYKGSETNSTRGLTGMRALVYFGAQKATHQIAGNQDYFEQQGFASCREYNRGIYYARNKLFDQNNEGLFKYIPSTDKLYLKVATNFTEPIYPYICDITVAYHKGDDSIINKVRWLVKLSDTPVPDNISDLVAGNKEFVSGGYPHDQNNFLKVAGRTGTYAAVLIGERRKSPDFCTNSQDIETTYSDGYKVGVYNDFESSDRNIEKLDKNRRQRVICSTSGMLDVGNAVDAFINDANYAKELELMEAYKDYTLQNNLVSKSNEKAGSGGLLVLIMALVLTIYRITKITIMKNK